VYTWGRRSVIGMSSIKIGWFVCAALGGWLAQKENGKISLRRETTGEEIRAMRLRPIDGFFKILGSFRGPGGK